ncbi:uncharacterized protein LOC128259124 [Drosophila gunungcola]|uniref:uncharacterized protein LOC128259124 n=1 Tax=Drosophila gunungcola TaxID=103775 RepID=UPI0022E88742|nr:uncharacterized protein LOC128259124 [Drosophila gunungcola]
MEKQAITEISKSSIFALGPAPPGFQAPNAVAFATTESSLRDVIRHLKDTNQRLENARVSLQSERNPVKRQAYKEKTMIFAKEQIRAKKLIVIYQRKLIDLQDAEISKVTRHLIQMEDLLRDVNNRLGNLRFKIKAETDPKKREMYVGSSFYMVREQHKTKGLCVRWRDRLEQLKKARIRKDPPAKDKPQLANKPQETAKTEQALVLKASEPKADQNETGCKRCAFLTKTNKQGQTKLCKICKKWAEDKNKLNINLTEPNELELRHCVDSSLNESTIKIEIEPVEMTEIEEMKSLEKETASNANVSKPSIVPIIVAVKSEAEEENNVRNDDLVDPQVITSLQSTLKSIDCKNMALAHLKILQEYAMLNDNFRAIGLLTEVEKSIINPPQNEDFDL